MIQGQWTKLERNEAHKVLEQLSRNKEAVVFSKTATEVSFIEFSFYSNYKAYRLINYATMPTFTMIFLGNDEEYISLDGTAAPIYKINEKAPISLNENNIIDYLNFFLSTVHGPEGDVIFIEDPNKEQLKQLLSPAQQDAAIKCFVSPSVEKQEENFKFKGTLYYGGGLVSVTITVTPNGHISFQDQKLLLSDIYIPETPYEQSWVEI